MSYNALTMMDVTPSLQDMMNMRISEDQIQQQRKKQAEEDAMKQRMLNFQNLQPQQRTVTEQVPNALFGQNLEPGLAQAQAANDGEWTPSAVQVMRSAQGLPEAPQQETLPATVPQQKQETYMPSLPQAQNYGEVLADQQIAAVQEAKWEKQEKMATLEATSYLKLADKFRDEENPKRAQEMVKLAQTAYAKYKGNPYTEAQATALEEAKFGVYDKPGAAKNPQVFDGGLNNQTGASLRKWVNENPDRFASAAVKADVLAQADALDSMTGIDKKTQRESIKWKQDAQGNIYGVVPVEKTAPGAVVKNYMPSQKGGTGRQVDVIDLNDLSTGTEYQSNLNMSKPEREHVVTRAWYEKNAPKAVLGFEIQNRLKDVESAIKDMPKGFSDARMAVINKAIDPHAFTVSRLGAGYMLSEKELALAEKMALLKESILGSKSIMIPGVGAGKDTREAIISTIPGQLSKGSFFSLKQLKDADKAISQAVSFVPRNLRDALKKQSDTAGEEAEARHTEKPAATPVGDSKSKNKNFPMAVGHAKQYANAGKPVKDKVWADLVAKWGEAQAGEIVRDAGWRK